jgi:hypothetical protein
VITSPVTNHGRFLPAFLFALFASLPFWSNPVVAYAQTRTSAIVFTVSGSGAEGSMDAVVLVEGKQLRAPYNSENEDAQKKFGEQYFAAGKVYRLIFGGGEAGTVKVDKWSVGCNNIHAQVTSTTSAKLGGKVMALATSSATLGKRSVSRRPPTESERAAVLALMKSIYQQKRTPATLMASIKVSNLTATDLDGDGKYEMIGSFTLTATNKFERDLFLIARPQGDKFVADFVKFQAYQPPPEEFLSSIDYVEQLDLDGDGIGEVFATQGGFDGYALLIFKKVAGRWRQVHDMIGDAC